MFHTIVVKLSRGPSKIKCQNPKLGKLFIWQAENEMALRQCPQNENTRNQFCLPPEPSKYVCVLRCMWEIKFGCI